MRQPFSRPACQHQHTPRVTHRPGSCLPSRIRLLSAPTPRSERVCCATAACIPGCSHHHTLTRVRTRARLSESDGSLQPAVLMYSRRRCEPPGRRSACSAIRCSQPSPGHHPHPALRPLPHSLRESAPPSPPSTPRPGPIFPSIPHSPRPEQVPAHLSRLACQTLTSTPPSLHCPSSLQQAYLQMPLAPRRPHMRGSVCRHPSIHIRVCVQVCLCHYT
jgi:hypothetical protein